MDSGKTIKKLTQSTLLTLLRLYRLIFSPILTALFGSAMSCRHIPTCSSYAQEAIRSHGSWKGCLFTLNRLCRCHPWGTSGYDPVPEIKTST